MASSARRRPTTPGLGLDSILGPGRPVYSPVGEPWLPSADVADCGDHLVLRLEVPGIDPAELVVVQRERSVTVQGVRHRPSGDENASFEAMEIQYGPFGREFVLPEYVDLESIEARYENGMLTIRAPKCSRVSAQSAVVRIHIQEQS